MTEERGVDGRSQVVEVGDPHVLAAAGNERGEETGATERVGEVAVSGGVGARLPVVPEKECPLARQAEPEVLREDGHVGGRPAPRQGLAGRALRGIAGHQP
jgi:hypothetical protein